MMGEMYIGKMSSSYYLAGRRTINKSYDECLWELDHWDGTNGPDMQVLQ